MNLVRKNATVIESVSLAGTATDPSILQLSTGNLVAIWAEVTGQPTDVSDDTDGGIYYRLLDASGAPIGDIQQANPDSPFLQAGPQGIAFANGGFGIGWTTFAQYGDSFADSDVFLSLFNSAGDPTLPEPIDIVPDTPAQTGTQGLLDSVLSDLSFYSFGQYGVTTADGLTYLFDVSSNFVAFVSYKPVLNAGDPAGPGDTVQLTNTNIVSAIASELPDPLPERDPEEDGFFSDDIVSIVISNSRFDGPDGVPGIFNDLFLDSQGAENEEIEEVKLAALASGGFAVSYRESVDQFGNDPSSTVRLEIFSSFGVRVHEASTPLNMTLDDPRGSHDMISLEKGGVVLAVVSDPGDGTGSDVEIILYDENAVEVSRFFAAEGVDADQAQPDLEQLDDGRIALSYTDASGRQVDGEVSPLHLAFFEVSGDRLSIDATAGPDDLAGVSGGDVLRGLAGEDTIQGRGGSDTLHGGADNDSLLGGSGNDALRGGTGDDTLNGGAGKDGLNGGADNDLLIGGGGTDILGGGLGEDVLRGGAASDILRGGGDNDRLSGQGGDDRARGGLGDDTIQGGAGDDSIFGGQGDDLLSGGGGDDVFVFRAGHGADRITDFSLEDDRIVLPGFSSSDISVSTSGGNTTIALGETDSITLVGLVTNAESISFDFG